MKDNATSDSGDSPVVVTSSQEGMSSQTSTALDLDTAPPTNSHLRHRTLYASPPPIDSDNSEWDPYTNSLARHNKDVSDAKMKQESKSMLKHKSAIKQPSRSCSERITRLFASCASTISAFLQSAVEYEEDEPPLKATCPRCIAERTASMDTASPAMSGTSSSDEGCASPMGTTTTDTDADLDIATLHYSQAEFREELRRDWAAFVANERQKRGRTDLPDETPYQALRLWVLGGGTGIAITDLKLGWDEREEEFVYRDIREEESADDEGIEGTEEVSTLDM